MKKLLLTVLFFLLIAYLYVHNVTRDVYSGDIGDIATAAYLFGVPHPPGYPLLTFLAFIFSKIPLPLPIISRMSLVSVTAALGGAVVYFFFAKQSIHDSLRQGKRKTKISEVVIYIIAILATSVLAFSYLYWLYAEVPEVFALSNFLLIAIYFASYKFYRTQNLIFLYATAFLVGLSLTNQQAILATFPGVAIFILPGFWRYIRKNRIKKTLSFVGKIFGAFFVGLLPYAYVFVSAATRPQINWLKEPTVSNFIRLVTRADYEFGTNLISLGQRFVVTGIYVTSLLNTYSWIIVVLVIVGMISVYKIGRQLFWALFIGFFVSGPLFIFIIATGIYEEYQLGVLERFFMHSFIIFLFFLPRGIVAVYSIFNKFLKKEIFMIILLLPLFIIPFQMVIYNSIKTDLSKTTIGYTLAYDILQPLPKDAVIFLKSDSITFNTWYAHYVLGLRPDVVLLSRGGDRTLFTTELLQAYRKKHPKEKDLPETQLVPRATIELSKTRSIFSTYMFSLYSKEYVWLPRGLRYQLVAFSDMPTRDEYRDLVKNDIKQLTILYKDELQPSEQNIIAPNISRTYSKAAVAIGDTFLVHYKDGREALTYYNLAKKIDADNSVIYAKQGIVLSLIPGNCEEAIRDMETAIAMYKVHKPYYTFTFQVYDRCKVDKEKVGLLKNDYKALFGVDWENDKQY